MEQNLHQNTGLIDTVMVMELKRNKSAILYCSDEKLFSDDIYTPIYASKSMFFLLVALLIFGFFFNEMLNIESSDEIIETVFCFIFIKALLTGKLNRKLGWDVKIFLCFLLFYPFYSITLNINTTKSILIDTLIQIKPYMTFFTIYYLGINLTTSQKKTLKNIVLFFYFFSIISLLIVILLPYGIDHGLYLIYGHSSKFYSGLIILGFLYLYCSEYTFKNLFFYFVMTGLGLVTMKGKMFGFFFASIALTVFIKRGLELRFSFKNMFLGLILFFGIFWVAQEKISFYFFGEFDSEHALARPFLYLTSFEIFKDFFPFGSGLASFGTHASRVTYSNLYYQYDLDNI